MSPGRESVSERGGNTDVDLAAYTLDRSKFGDGRVLARIVSYEAFIEYAIWS